MLTGDSRANAVIELPPGASIPIQLRWAGAGFPRDVERAMRDARLDGAVPIVVAARAISPGARAMLDADDVSWLTESGGAHLHLGSIVIERNQTETARRPTRDDDAPRWTPAIAAVAETILTGYVHTRAEGIPRTTTLAARSGRSLGSVTAALQEFDRMRWTQPPPVSRGPSARRHLLDPTTMLDRWAEQASRADQATRYHSFHRASERTAQSISDAFAGDAAFGGRFAADLIAPFSSVLGPLRCYVSDAVEGRDLQDRLTAAGLTRADESNRVEIIHAPQNVMSGVEQRGGHPIASPVRVYADLLHDGVCGDDAAQHLRDVAVGF